MKQYGIRTGDYIYKGDSVRDERHLETLAGARRMVKRMMKADKAAGITPPRRFIVVREVSQWFLVEEAGKDGR